MQYEQILKPPGVFEAENDPVLREKDERKRLFKLLNYNSRAELGKTLQMNTNNYTTPKCTAIKSPNQIAIIQLL